MMMLQPATERIDDFRAYALYGNKQSSGALKIPLHLPLKPIDLRFCRLILAPSGFKNVVESLEVDVAINLLNGRLVRLTKFDLEQAE